MSANKCAVALMFWLLSEIAIDGTYIQVMRPQQGGRWSVPRCLNWGDCLNFCNQFPLHHDYCTWRPSCVRGRCARCTMIHIDSPWDTSISDIITGRSSANGADINAVYEWGLKTLQNRSIFWNDVEYFVYLTPVEVEWFWRKKIGIWNRFFSAFFILVK